jgi:nitrate/nitrite transporter NarK
MLALRDVNRVLTRNRRVTALVGVMLLLGVAALSTHAALPEHHETGEEICLCAFALATLCAVGLGLGRSFVGRLIPCRRMQVLRAPLQIAAAVRVGGMARAGPPVLLVLRR